MNNSEEMNTKRRYQNSKVYKLVNTIDSTFYIVSTCNSLSKRLNEHKSDSKKTLIKKQKYTVI